MVWVKKKGTLCLADSKIVKRDFIIAEGSTSNYNFLSGKENPFGRSIFIPVFYLFKVHKNHPMRIISTAPGYSVIWPANENKRGKKNFRFPAEVFKDKKSHDLTTFALVPFVSDDFGKWEKTILRNSFSSGGDYSKSSSLLYANHGASINFSGNTLYKISEVMPSQVDDFFFHWLRSNHKIDSHNKTFDRKLEGRIEVPIGIAKDVANKVRGVLEKRYKTSLIHKNFY